MTFKKRGLFILSQMLQINPTYIPVYTKQAQAKIDTTFIIKFLLFYFTIIISSEMQALTFILTNLDFFYQRLLCENFGWILPKGSIEKIWILLFCIIYVYIPKVSRKIAKVTRLFAKVQRLFEKGSTYFENVSHSFAKVSGTYLIIFSKGKWAHMAFVIK